MDYKSTINLPTTNFQMQANLQNKELEILDYWKKKKNTEKNSFKKKLFVLNDGPPYANGEIHMGHAFNKILKDIICKFKKLNGYNIHFVPGWDCHGLPIELNVEKKLKNIKNIVSDNEFREICKSYAKLQIEIQKKSFIRLGVNANWNSVYKTMDYNLEASIIESFKIMLEKKYIYLGFKPIYWCFECSSALAEAEIEYYIKRSISIYIYFKFIESPFKKNKEKSTTNLIVWTTTPWTLPFNQAIAINDAFLYILFQHKREKYIINKDLFYAIKKKTTLNNLKIEKVFKASTINNKFLIHPFYKKKIKIILSKHVKNDSGTGCVHIAPAYGHDDYKIGLKYNLQIKNKINEVGYFDNNVLFIKDMHLLKTNKNVISILKYSKKILLKEIIAHKYPYCWRHKTVLIFRTTKQWFLNINNKNLKKKIINLSKCLINWIPKIGSIKIKNMTKNRLDWCISRQRVWGVPIMLFVEKTNKLHINTFKILNESINLTKKYGSDFWYKINVFDLFKIDYKKYFQVIDVLDVWFDSSVIYNYISKTYKIKIPLDLCIEGSDQYRGWFQVSLINAISTQKKVPYKNILTHGFVLDNQGKKMSKSLNNIVSPDYVIKKYGADIFRLWVSSVNYHFDINFSNETIKNICEAYRKIRNTLRFMMSNLNDINIKKTKNVYMLKFDIWILYRLFLTKKDIEKEKKLHRFHLIYKKIYNFCTDDLCSKYFEVIKDKLYTLNSNSRKSSQITLYIILYTIIKLISPILSFTAEEIWKYLYYKDTELIFNSNFKTNLKKIKEITFKVKEAIYLEQLFNIKSAINKSIEKNRFQKKITTTLELRIEILCNVYWYSNIDKIKNEARTFFAISELIIKKTNIKKDIDFIIKKTKLKKCERCWNRTLKKNSKLNICKKCINNLYYKNKKKSYL